MAEENKKTDEVAEQAPAQPVSTDQKPDVPKKADEIDEMTTLHERAIAALSYVSFFAIIPFYLKKDSKFCRFHGKQGMVIALIFFFAQLLFVLDILDDLAKILQFAVFIYGGLAALSGRWKKMPWVYDRACQLEEQLSLKTKDELANEKAYKPNEVEEKPEDPKPKKK